MGGDYGDGGPIKRKRELLKKNDPKAGGSATWASDASKEWGISGEWWSPIQAYDQQCHEREDAQMPITSQKMFSKGIRAVVSLQK